MDITDKQKVWTALTYIPEGFVVTYAQLAELAGFSRKYARVIGYLLSQLPDNSKLPWHRVVNHKGRLAFSVSSSRYKHQRTRLENEGIIFQDERFSLIKYQWHATL